MLDVTKTLADYLLFQVEIIKNLTIYRLENTS